MEPMTRGARKTGRLWLGAIGVLVLLAVLAGLLFQPPSNEDLFATPKTAEAVDSAKRRNAEPPSTTEETSPGTTVPTSEIHVRILSPDGSRPAGARAQVRNQDGSILLRPDGEVSGNFVFRALPSKGPWIVAAACDDSLPEFRGGIAPGTLVTFVLGTSMAMYCEVVDQDGFPVEGARVVIYSGEGDLPEEIGRTDALVEMDGRHRAFPVPRKSGRAVARKDDLSAELAFEAPAEGTANLRIVIPDVPRIDGLVMDENGLRLEGIRVRAIVEGRSIASGISRPDGRYALHLPAGTEVAVANDHIADLRYLLTRVSDVTSPATGIDLRLRRNQEAPAVITARVLAPDGSPVKDLRTRFTIDGIPGHVNSGSDDDVGEEPFRTQIFVAGALRGEFRSSAGFARIGPVTIERGAEVDLGEIRLQAAITVSGRILGPDDAPVNGWRILTGPGAEPEPVQSGESGRFTVSGLIPGDSVLHVVHNDFETATVKVLAGPGETLDLGTLRLRPGTAVLRGNSATSSKSGDINIVLKRDVDAVGSAPKYSFPVDEHGRFEIRGLPSGNYETSIVRTVSSKGNASISRGRNGPSVTLAEGETKEIQMPAIE